jgi:hypothetical protein
MSFLIFRMPSDMSSSRRPSIKLPEMSKLSLPNPFSSRRNSRTSAPPSPGGLTVPGTSASSESNESRSTRSTSPDSRGRKEKTTDAFNRARSSSSASFTKVFARSSSQEKEFAQAENWKDGFVKYNKLVTNQVSKDAANESEKFAKTCKILTKKESVGGHFVHGLPEAVLDLALLWCPAERMLRKPIEDLESDQPSWSWMGWEGAVNFPFDPNSSPDICRVKGEFFESFIKRFTVGSTLSTYAMRRDKRSDEKKDSKLRIRCPADNLLAGAKPPSAGSNALRFETYTTAAENFFTTQMKNKHGAEIPCTQIQDGEEGPVCGVIMDYEDQLGKSTESPHSSTFEFILLSRNRRCDFASHSNPPASNIAHPPGTPSWAGDRFSWEEQIEDFDEKVYPKGEWNMLNVMLIQHLEEGFAERVAIARIHEDAWNKRPRVKKQILLK